MYMDHQPIISAWARSKPENLARVLQFCTISARQKFFNLPALIEEARQPDSGVLWGWKAEAYRLAWVHREEIHWHCEDIADLSRARQFERATYLVAYLSNLYGFNVAKAGFACQLAYGVSGCLDSVNIERLGLPPRQFADFSRLKTRQGQLKRAVQYNITVSRAGGTERLWDDWCAAISDRYPTQFPTPDHASAFHVECILHST